jgi:hypothetical protein
MLAPASTDHAADINGRVVIRGNAGRGLAIASQRTP